MILDFIWLLVFDNSIFQILALYLDFEGAKNIYVLYVLIWGFGGCWKFLTGVWEVDLIWIGSLVFDTSIFQILKLYIEVEGAKNIYVL